MLLLLALECAPPKPSLPGKWEEAPGSRALVLPPLCDLGQAWNLSEPLLGRMEMRLR